MCTVSMHCVGSSLLWQQHKTNIGADVTWIETPGAWSSVETFLSKLLIPQEHLLPYSCTMLMTHQNSALLPIPKLTAPHIGKNAEQPELSCIVLGNIKWYDSFENICGISYIIKHTPKLWTSNHTLRLWPKNENICTQNTFCMNVHKIFMQNSLQLKIYQVAINKRMKK